MAAKSTRTRIQLDCPPEPEIPIPVRTDRAPRRAVILCPGPSLLDFGDRDDYDLRIGVNRAAGEFRCDYWVALDVHTAGLTVPLASPAVVTRPNIHDQMCQEFSYVKGLRHVSPTGLVFRAGQGKKIAWMRFGATLALVLAAELGASWIDCFGVDWSGRADFDGFTSARNRRSDERWHCERTIWTQIVEALAQRGITVRRVLYADASNVLARPCGHG